MWVVLLSCCLASVNLIAQTPDTATIHGQVTDEDHGTLSGVQIKIRNGNSGLTRTTETNASGEYSLAGLPIGGQCLLTAQKPGFAEAQSSPVLLAGGTTVQVNFQLSLSGGTTQITVTGTADQTRIDEPQLGDRLTAKQMEETPLLNRKITWLPLLNAANRPAINQGDVFMNQNLFTTNGSGRRQTWFEIDGSSGSDVWGRQTIFTNVPLAAVQEMTVLENAFSAEYGFSSGSVVNIVTKSGGDQFDGELLELWRPSATEAALAGFTSATAANGNDLTNDTLTQTSLSVSGPLDRNHRTHYFAAGEYSAEDRASPVVSPIAPGNFIGHYRDWLGFFRLDHQLNETNSLFFRSDVDGFHDTNPNGAVGGNALPSVDRVFRRRTYAEDLGETAVLNPSLTNNVRLQFQLASPITEFDPVIYGTQSVVPVSSGGTFTSGTSQSALLMNRQYEANDVLSVAWGKHQIRFGADVIVAHSGGNSKEYGGPIYDGQLQYKTCTQPLAYCESAAFLNNIGNVQSYTQSYGNASYTVNDTLWAVFVQDDYRVTPNLTVNLGLRYEQQNFTDSRNDFAPRVGFAYNWRGDGKTVLRGGYGIYDGQIVDNAEANYALGGPAGVFNYTAGPGQLGFPASVSDVPLAAFPAGAVPPVRSLYIRPGQAAYLNQFFPASTLKNYPSQLLNPYSEQWTFGVQHEIRPDWVLSVDYLGAHTLRINRPLDVDAPAPFVRTAPGQVRSAQTANCSRPYWIYWYSEHGATCNPAAATRLQPPYSVIQTDINDGYAYYDALDVNLSHRFGHHISMLASYVWSHAIDNVDPDIPNQNPNDPNFIGRVESGNAIFDQRQRLVLSGIYAAPWKITIGGVSTLASGLPYNITTGITNSGDNGATTDRPVINGSVVGRNTGRGRPIYDFSPFAERALSFGSERYSVLLRAEAFNVLNHPSFVGYSGTYGNGALPGPGFGEPLAGITNQLPARSFQFSAKFNF